MKYHQHTDGEWVKMKNPNNHKIKCCDCGLVHNLKFSLRDFGKAWRKMDGRLYFSATINSRSTAAARRKEYLKK